MRVFVLTRVAQIITAKVERCMWIRTSTPDSRTFPRTFPPWKLSLNNRLADISLGHSCQKIPLDISPWKNFPITKLLRTNPPRTFSPEQFTQNAAHELLVLQGARVMQGRSRSCSWGGGIPSFPSPPLPSFPSPPPLPFLSLPLPSLSFPASPLPFLRSRTP